MADQRSDNSHNQEGDGQDRSGPPSESRAESHDGRETQVTSFEPPPAREIGQRDTVARAPRDTLPASPEDLDPLIGTMIDGRYRLEKVLVG